MAFKVFENGKRTKASIVCADANVRMEGGWTDHGDDTRAELGVFFKVREIPETLSHRTKTKGVFASSQKVEAAAL